MFSVASLRMPRDENAMAILRGHGPVSWEKIDRVIVPRKGTLDISVCRVADVSRALVAVGAQCVVDEMGKCGPEIDFSSGRPFLPGQASGFSPGEDAGRWSDGAKAQFSCKLKGEKFRTARLIAHSFTPHGRSQRVKISIGNESPREFLLGEESAVLEIPLMQKALSDDRFVITFDLPDAISPLEAKRSVDPRKLGIWVSRIELVR
jgi:hypothetical protein